MNKNHPNKNNPAEANPELQQLLAELVEGSISDEQFQTLGKLLIGNPAAQQQYREYVELHAMLQFEHRPQPAILPDAFRAEIPLIDSLPPAPIPGSAIPGSEVPGTAFFGKAPSGFGGGWFSLGFLALAIVLGVAAAEGWLLFRSNSMTRIAREVPEGIDNTKLARRTNGAQSALLEQGRIRARFDGATLVNLTNCRWDPVRSTADIRSGLVRPGQCVNLLEGVAEINSRLPSGALAEFQLEGPLALMLTSEGMPNLLFGRLTASFRSDYDRFTIETPVGRVVVPEDASIGIVAAANNVELHVFSGAAIFENPSAKIKAVPDQLVATSGTSLRARVAADGAISIERGQSRESHFVTPTSLAESQLFVSEEYVKAIHRAKPFAYWRFESDEGGLIRNEMGDWLHCRMMGDAVRLHSGSGNRSAEFGVVAGSGYLFSDDVVDEVSDSFATEAWVKPAYYHHAVLFSLVEPTEKLRYQHRFHLELCGPGPGHTSLRPWESHPNQIRLLHAGRGQCYSTIPYLLRKWQHIAVVKDETDMRLYVNGQLAASVENPAPLGNRLHVLMGQLYPKDAHGRDVNVSRLFVGQLDEVAFYKRALSQQEIQEHFRLARPESERPAPDS